MTNLIVYCLHPEVKGKIRNRSVTSKLNSNVSCRSTFPYLSRSMYNMMKRNETQHDLKAEESPKVPLNMMLSNIQVNQNVRNILNIDLANLLEI